MYAVTCTDSPNEEWIILNMYPSGRRIAVPKSRVRFVEEQETFCTVTADIGSGPIPWKVKDTMEELSDLIFDY